MSAFMPFGSSTRRYCDCEDFPCCGHTDDDGSAPDMTDEEIKQSVYDRDDDETMHPDDADYWR